MLLPRSVRDLNHYVCKYGFGRSDLSLFVTVSVPVEEGRENSPNPQCQEHGFGFRVIRLQTQKNHSPPSRSTFYE